MDEKTSVSEVALGDTKEQFANSVVLLRAVRSTVARLLREVEEGNGAALKELVAKQSELESALRRAFDTEQKFNDWHARQTGAGGPGDIDFDAVRYEIGCRLSRLRACCGSD